MLPVLNEGLLANGNDAHSINLGQDHQTAWKIFTYEEAASCVVGIQLVGLFTGKFYCLIYPLYGIALYMKFTLATLSPSYAELLLLNLNSRGGYMKCP